MKNLLLILVGLLPVIGVIFEVDPKIRTGG